MPLRIYYLDDEADLLDVFFETFSAPGIEITTFSDPQTALAAVRSNPPDLLFLDYRLPNITGDELAGQLDPKLPKALVTGAMNIVLRAHFDAVFPKPYEVEEVQTFIDSFLQRRTAQTPAA